MVGKAVAVGIVLPHLSALWKHRGRNSTLLMNASCFSTFSSLLNFLLVLPDSLTARAQLDSHRMHLGGVPPSQLYTFAFLYCLRYFSALPS